ncbi:L,D-transpeptidase family protein [Granulicoccus phenolivorans]|uniref:L,D-transpeptidase family protein n=2 Tax=Granulicoccus phenolivorans TaxID=266854 RepID=UPI00040408E0|nr:L,D-transpeptidase family protein [Granulicoccus phenolivorans]
MKRTVSALVGVTAASLLLSVPGLASAAPTPTPTPSATPVATAAPTAPTPGAATPGAPTPAAPTPTRTPAITTPPAPASPSTPATPTPAPTPSASAQAIEVKGAIKEVWDRNGGAAGPLGQPVAAEFQGAQSAWLQQFTGGWIVWTPGIGGYTVRGGLLGGWLAQGRDAGPLGVPTGEGVQAGRGSWTQSFSGGRLYWISGSRAYAVRGAILGVYQDSGWENGTLGLPVGNEYASANGSIVQNFEFGKVVWSSNTGAFIVKGALRVGYDDAGAEGGALGLPVGNEFAVNGGWVQNFQYGNVMYHPAHGVHTIKGALQDAYGARGWEGGFLGWPTGNEYASAGGYLQQFENGQLMWHPATGAFAVNGGILGAYAKYNWEVGDLGFPTRDAFQGRNGTWIQHFQGGQIFWTPGVGGYRISGGIMGAYARNGWEAGSLGAPAGDAFQGGQGSWIQHFQGGQIFWASGVGGYKVQNAMLAVYDNLGWENGPLGLPVEDERPGVQGTWIQAFQGGQTFWNPNTGGYAVRGALLQEYGRQGWEAGQLGAPASNEYEVSGGWSQDFQYGRLNYINGSFSITWPGPDVDARCRYGRVMCISKADKKLRWMIDGQVLLTMDARFGVDATPTREGEYKVFSKVRDEISWMYGNTPMPFAMYFSGGQAVHYSYDFAARGQVGGSHGCVNIRDWNGIQWLYDTQVKLGDRVVVYW